ncbi:MAG TPA: hypothetical protein VH107_10115 [Lacipirellulaceae bacterium]|jgi:hypothetical protein|nr:hypothetical protein [Lacipirellulaceae bacterium]
MKLAVIAVLALATIGLAIGAVVHFAPADETPHINATNNAINETYGLILGYLKSKKRLPKTLDQLRDADGPNVRTTDGWGRPLLYTITSDGFLLKSLGRDDEPGGVGPDEDHFMHYQPVKSPADPKP